MLMLWCFWTTRLADIYAGYADDDLYNCDETGCFWRQTTTKTLFLKDEQCKGGKQSKERITLLLCASFAGEKEKPLVIGKADKPRCFKNMDKLSLPVTYAHNKKAWMTSHIFEKWLRDFDERMKKAGRNILLFLDNATCHPAVALSNIKLVFLPPNTTSVLQPMDQGIIQTVKLKYRKRQLQRLLRELEKDPDITGPEVAKKIHVLDAIQWLDASWNETAAETITKCFKHCGFKTRVDGDISSHDISASDADQLADIPAALQDLARDLYNCEFNELIASLRPATQKQQTGVKAPYSCYKKMHVKTKMHQTPRG